MNFLRQSTAVDIKIGPFVDATDGVTAETALTLSQADFRLAKNNGAWAQVNDNTAAVHEENGWYEKELDATDTNTVGILIVAVNESGALPVWREFQVVEEAVYDALLAASGTGALPVSTGGIAATAFATGAIDAAALAADAGTEIGTAVWASAARTLTALDEDSTTLDLDATIRAAVGLAAANLDTQLTAIDDAVDTEIGALTTAVADLPTNAELATALGTADDAVLAAVATVDTVVDAIKAKTDSLTFTVANQLDANVQSINDVTITGDGQVGTEFGV